MKDLIVKTVHLYSLILRDLSDLSDSDLSRDFVTISNRSGHEGLPFLTRTLPTFGDNFFQSLKAGTFQPQCAFSNRGALPKFLSGLTSRVFDADTGVLLKDPCYVAAFCVRQICYLLYKLEVPLSEEMCDTAVKEWEECDKALDEQVNVSSFDKVLLLASSLISEVLGPFSWEDTNPRHGPGACSHRIDKPWQKWSFWDDGSEILPDDYYSTPGLEPTAVCGTGYDLETRLGLTPHTVHNMSQSKMSLVPKTSKGPRIISGEAVRRMWAQLGLDDLIRERISIHPYSRRSIPFKDQSVNARLALEASESGDRATIDLSKASDTNAKKLCQVLLPVEWFRAMERIRSTEMRLPSGRSHVLSMMSPMGNGFTFSLESLVFWALTSATIAVCMEETYTSEDDLKWACQNTSVYGDDIIVPTEYACEVMSSLERYGFRINRDKSYWTGPFRESCGTDAFLGADITPLKIKTPPRTDKKKRKSVDATFVASWWDQAKAWAHLLPQTSAWMKEEIYTELGFVPTYPEGWEGCIGEPTSYERIHGRPVEVGQQGISAFQNVVRGPLRNRAKSGGKQSHVSEFVIIRDYTPPPSNGKLVKIVRVKSPSVKAPLDEFSEDLEYFRWLQTHLRRSDNLTMGDSRTFTLRYSQMVSIRREWLS